jgi:peptidoglycan hydrolase-like protein with peptidoglycan-binding domain
VTLAMPDSIYPDDLPPGYGQYLGYADGQWVTAPVLRKKFPAARIVALTVNGSTLDADGCDREPWDLTPEQAADWTARKRARDGGRPVVYVSAANVTGALDALAARSVTRDQVRLLSAHYGIGEHICAPDVPGCGYPAADGTQWSDAFPGVNGLSVDMSVLNDGFFGPAPVPPWQEAMMQALPTIREGSAGGIVRTIQGLCCARGHATAIDGDFGPGTDAAVRACQEAAKVAVDGIVGPVTWRVLVGVA